MQVKEKERKSNPYTICEAIAEKFCRPDFDDRRSLIQSERERDDKKPIFRKRLDIFIYLLF